MQWLVPLPTHSSLYLIPKLLWLIQNRLPLQISDGGVIAASEVHKLLTNICDILNSAVSKEVGNTPCNLAYILQFLACMVASTGPGKAHQQSSHGCPIL